jgi:DNA sulfur modification protein DndC
MREIELITLAELAEIRRHWVLEKHELEDNLPAIYQDVLGVPFPGGRLDDNLVIGAEEMRILREVCADDVLHFELARELLDVERQHRSMARRHGLFKALEQAFRRGYYDSADDAEQRALSRRDVLLSARASAMEPDLPFLQAIDGDSASDIPSEAIER